MHTTVLKTAQAGSVVHSLPTGHKILLAPSPQKIKIRSPRPRTRMLQREAQKLTLDMARQSRREEKALSNVPSTRNIKIFFASQASSVIAMKKKMKKACQICVEAHPAQAPEGKTLGNRGRDHHNPLYSSQENSATAILSDRARTK